ncbi:hypothetical protein JHK85_018465 [Glycine max]|nr:hypothetical protein JHK85_018465 [Glycine max]KAG5037228.1 hypothetical protein JHK86_018068 [Glycine max]
MLGTALQFGGVRGDDRLYIPVKARKNQNQRKPVQREKSGGETESTDSVSKRELAASENGNPNESSYSLNKPSSCPSVEPASNIDRFLESTTLSVTAQYLAKVHLILFFMQLSYVLSYGTPVNCRDSSSEGNSDSEFGKRSELFIAQRNSQYHTGDASFEMSRLSVHDKHNNNTMQVGFSTDDSETWNPKDLLFEYFDHDPPYSREPFSDKILDLAHHYPSLKSLRICDLLPASWMCVAWYPIYRIPTGPTLKDLDAWFLTYHTLHTPLAGNGSTQAPILVYPNDMDGGVPKISLPTFAMASYKLKGSIYLDTKWS